MANRPRPAPMTAETAREIGAEMQRKTSKRARVGMLRFALGPLGNLSPEAREVYAAALEAEAA